NCFRNQRGHCLSLISTSISATSGRVRHLGEQLPASCWRQAAGPGGRYITDQRKQAEGRVLAQNQLDQGVLDARSITHWRCSLRRPASAAHAPAPAIASASCLRSGDRLVPAEAHQGTN